MAGLLAGLERLGFALPVGLPNLALQHGPLMIVGFLTTVIGLERAVALQTGWAFWAPLLSGAGALLYLAGLPHAPLLMAGGAVILSLSALEGLRRQPSLHAAIMALGAVCGTTGSLAWALGLPLHQVVGLWMAFLTLTIAGERLELTRFLPPRRGRTPSLLLLVALILIGATASTLGGDVAPRLLGSAFLGLAIWLLIFDIARRNLMQTGLSRFIGLALSAGYFWLGLGGFALLHHGMPAGGYEYDAVLHILFLGFVFSMIFGHAPVILPAVLTREAPYHPLLLVWLGLLHLSLVLRLIGDHNEIAAIRQIGGALGEVAILLFIVTMAVRTVRAGRS
ncbi:MAG: hypothetical protein HQL43_14460 [Alphaproteobacteria bacterium]|nr:hypothetical protein [Alphaproteobacteria bacterium]